jgi:hypothetical protein
MKACLAQDCGNGAPAVSGATQASTISDDPFQERTIDVEERGEEAVVSKEARMVELQPDQRESARPPGSSSAGGAAPLSDGYRPIRTSGHF